MVLGRHLGISWVKKNAVRPQQLLYILLQLLLLLDDEAGGFGGTECLKQGQTWRSHTHTSTHFRVHRKYKLIFGLTVTKQPIVQNIFDGNN